MTGLVVVLAPPRCFGSVVAAMLGQHPDLYGLPQVNLFVAETMGERAGMLAARPLADHGLLRAVAQLVSGEQTVPAVTHARRWLHARRRVSTLSVFRELMDVVRPRIVVERSTVTVEHVAYMQRARRSVEGVKFLHVLRHPLTQGQSLLRSGGLAEVARLCGMDPSRPVTMPDPQRAWFTLHANICTFLDGLAKEATFRVRGEDLLADPETHLRQIAQWLGIRGDRAAVDAMTHPERSPFAAFGPLTARLGNDPGFLRDPRPRAQSRARSPSLSDPLPWASARKAFSPEVVDLAREFGYQ
jgi:hypothetical protein